MSMPSGLDIKKRKSGAETPSLARDLLPKPTTSSPAPISQRKRGRPSKADVECKQREAIERGDIIPTAPVFTSPSPPISKKDLYLLADATKSGFPPSVIIFPAPTARTPLL
jgi:hypothetical protein